YSADFPLVKTLQGHNNGNYDAFVASLNAAGDGLLFSDYLGGAASDTATALALDSYRNIYVAGWTLSSDFPLRNSYQLTNGGGYGAFVAKFQLAQLPVPVSVAPSSGSGNSQTFGFVFSDASGYQSLLAAEVLFNTQISVNKSCYIYIAP